jgi:aldose 1-epimerase
MTLTGTLHPVTLPGNDLREERDLRTVIPQLLRRHGDLYRLPAPSSGDTARKPRHAARLFDPLSGRVLNVFTTEEYLQLYTGCGFDGTLTGKSGVPYRAYQGLCLECEGYPDGAGVPALGDILLRPGMPRVQRTTYQFSAEGTPSHSQEPS